VQTGMCLRRYKPEDSHLHTHRRKNLKSYLILIYKVVSQVFELGRIFKELILILLGARVK
jgi:hypothetical protein